MGHVATPEGIKSSDVRDLMVTSVEHRFGTINRLPATIEWLTDNGSCYIAAETRHFARQIGLEPLTTPVESPRSNGMAAAFMCTLKRDYVRVNPRPDAATVIRSLPAWYDHYNRFHPHRALGYSSPREFIARWLKPRGDRGGIQGATTREMLRYVIRMIRYYIRV
jgi:putative transposase